MTKLEELKAKLDNLQNLYDSVLEENLEKAFERIEELEKENAVIKKALHLYIDWADECDIAWDNFPDMKEKWWKVVEEKGLGWIDGLMFMVIEEAKEQLLKKEHNVE